MAIEPDEARHYFRSLTGQGNSSKTAPTPPDDDDASAGATPAERPGSHSTGRADAGDESKSPPETTAFEDQPESEPPAHAGPDASGEPEDWEDYHRDHPESEYPAEYHGDLHPDEPRPEAAEEPGTAPASAVVAPAPVRSGDRGGPPDEPAAPTTDEEEDGGGPVKTFLEHMEDLRWVLIKCVASLVVGLVVCLVGANWIISQLKRPLVKAGIKLAGTDHVLEFRWGTNVLWKVSIGDGPIPGFGQNLKDLRAIQVVPVQDGTNLFLKLEPVATKAGAPAPAPAGPHLNVLGPFDPFVIAMKVALFGGFGLASPFLLYFIGEFVVPALRRKEKKFLVQAVGFGGVLFVVGVLFCYFVMVPVALYAAVRFAAWMGFGAEMWRAQEYISFVVKFLIGMGVGFELPVVLLTLVRIDLLDYHRLQRLRPYMVVILLIIAAILTPPDVVSMLLMAIPLMLLYELTVVLAWLWERRKPKA